jgi:simple sugar transport system substrate-binding protein
MHRRQLLQFAAGSAAAVLTPWSAWAQNSKKKTMVMVVKIAGIPWYNLVEQGMKKAAPEFNMDVSMVGPANVDPAQQVRLVEDLIARKVDIIGVAPIDGNVLKPVLKRARDAGILVVTQDAPNEDGIDWDVELVDARQFGEATMISLAQGMHEEGSYVAYVGTLSTPSHNQWCDAAIAYQKAHYPKMKLATERFPGADEIDTAYKNTLNVIKTYPDLKGIVAYGSNGAIGAGNAVRQQRLQDKITIVGTSVPSQAKSMIADGTIRETFLWNPFDTGYAIVAVANHLESGAAMTDGMDVKGLGPAKVDSASKVVSVNKIMRVNKSTIDELLKLGI